MSAELWTAVDRFIQGHLHEEDPKLDAALASNVSDGLPPLDVSPPQAKMLHLLARAVGSERILEIGTLGGYSTIWLARAVSKTGRVITLEINPHHAQTASKNLQRAGLEDRVEIRIGDARQSLASLSQESHPLFDFAFLDADKASNADYLDLTVPMLRPGALIVVDNVVRQGAILDTPTSDPDVQGVLRLFHALQNDSRVSSTAIQTVGSKGHDGFVLAIVNT